MDISGYGVDKMAQPVDFGATIRGKRMGRGVCGNFRFKFYDIANCDDWNSIVDNKGPVLMAASTNTGANTDIFGCGPMEVQSTADGNTANELVDSAATFSSAFSGLQAHNEDDNISCILSTKDLDECYCFKNGVANDTFPDGNEVWSVTSDRHVEMNSAAATYEGYLIVFGR